MIKFQLECDLDFPRFAVLCLYTPDVQDKTPCKMQWSITFIKCNNKNEEALLGKYITKKLV